jgi:hypothetical protein
MFRKLSYSKGGLGQDMDDMMSIEHLEHCYEQLRQSIMCSADVTAIPWQWSTQLDRVYGNLAVTHTCRDFEAIQDWARDQTVLNFDPQTLVPRIVMT